MIKNFCKFAALVVFSLFVFSCSGKGREDETEHQEIQPKVDSQAGQTLENKKDGAAQSGTDKDDSANKADDLYKKALNEASIIFEFETVNKKISLSLIADKNVKIEGAVPSEIPADGSEIEVFIAKNSIALLGDVKELKILDSGILNKVKIIKAQDLRLLDISFSGLKNIEFLDCPVLENLVLEGNKQMERPDFSSLKGLKKLNLAKTAIHEVDFSSFSHLEYLDISSVNLKALDLTKNIELKELYCENAGLKNLDVSKNVKLTHLNCRENRLDDLSIFQNKELKFLDCGKNGLDTLLINLNTKLQRLHCDSNEIKDLDISSLKEIEEVYCYRNKIENIVLGSNIKLKSLFCFENNIDEKSMKTLFDSLIAGDGYNFKTIVVYAEKNPNLIYKPDKYFDHNFVPTEEMLNSSSFKFWKVYFTLYGLEDIGSILDSLLQKTGEAL
ncbi:leucine-rich repeat domain-containing protein [Treponema putidum]|uniref:leucine-rich repeat domain-containing protein n=1 Tax=Treponema putidum TaxID=221027 RepID=UPI003D8B90A2